MPKPCRPRGLYLITPDDADTHRLCARVEAVAAHATWLQYRNKPADDALRLAQARALVPICRRAGIALLINDDVALAQRVGADGVHLGEDDAGVADARHQLGRQAIIGASCYDDLERAHSMRAAGASYLAFGACFPSPTKPQARRAAPSLLRAAAALDLPVVAIGGITPDNAPRVITAGADLVAVITGVFDAPDPVAAARAFAQAFRHTGQ